MGNLLSYYSDVEGPGECGSGVFIPEKVDGVGDKGSGSNTSSTEASGLPGLGTIPQLQKYLEFWRSSIQIKGILLQTETLK